MIHKHINERENSQERHSVDYILIDENIGLLLNDVSLYRGAGRGIKNHYLVIAKVEIRGCFKFERGRIKERVVKVREFEKERIIEDLKQLIADDKAKAKNKRVSNMEEEYERLNKCHLICAAKVFGYVSIGRKN